MTRMTVLTTGSHGDHAPYVGLGRALRPHGHEVTLAGVERFRSLAEAAGVDFATLPGDPRDPELTDRSHAANGGGLRGMRALLDLGVEQARAQAAAMTEAVEGADVVGATVATVLLAAPIAEAHGLPLVVLPLQPARRTAEFAPPALGGGDLGPRLNRGVADAVGAVATRLYAPVVREVRAALDLPREDPRRSAERIEGLPVLHGVSPAVVGRPDD